VKKESERKKGKEGRGRNKKLEEKCFHKFFFKLELVLRSAELDTFYMYFVLILLLITTACTNTFCIGSCTLISPTST